MSSVGHLVRRFFGSLRPSEPSASDEAWAISHLGRGEVVLWRRMSNADRRHAIGVARRVDVALRNDASTAVLAAALLHDVGKLDSGLGTFSRVAATVLSAAFRRERLTRRDNRLARYLRHDEIGAALLTAAGSDPLTVAWAREHHRAPSGWTLPPDLAAALKSADDD
ncbi:MAG TPA: HD domain-containing protein [Acidimicrobiales bacterium]|nr:HD domain-containing protein [Acidimicrobiales bacterium]